MKSWYKIQQLINDVLGTILAIWGATLLTIRTPDWTYVVLILIGGSMVVGKQVLSNIPGLGGGFDKEPDDVKSS
jgi:hypothetical protein